MIPSYKVVVLLCSVLLNGKTVSWVEASFCSIAQAPGEVEVTQAHAECAYLRDALAQRNMSCTCVDIRREASAPTAPAPKKQEI